jgi:hypothetical protein
VGVEVTDRLAAHATPTLPMDDLPPEVNPLLAKRFLLPPFSVLDARSGPWQDRKKMWLRMGLRSEEGRTARMLAKSVGDEWVVDPDTGEEYLKGAPPGSVNQKILAVSNGQSIFDPVLCELAYSWFCPPGGRVLDPYAGGSVRGLTAAFLGRPYVGIDLSPGQVEANRSQAEAFGEAGHHAPGDAPTWHVADSWAALYAGTDGDVADAVDTDGPYDFIWSCPPYHDLEVYSEDPADHSNVSWEDFTTLYAETIAGAVERLADDRFAAFVIGEIRAPGPGYYRDFMGLTVRAFEEAGAHYYNEMILITSVGTLPLRTGKQFVVSRKIGKTHQTILVFCKGDPRRAAEACLEREVIAAALEGGGRTLDAVVEAEEVEGADDLTGGNAS